MIIQSGVPRISIEEERMTRGKRTKDKEERILQAAVRLFGRKGYHASSIADIADEAGVAAGTIYLYFKRKEDLLVRLFQKYIGGYVEDSRPAIRAAEPGLARLYTLVSRQLRFFDADKTLARAFEIHLREVNPVIRDGIRPTLRDYFVIIDEVIEEGKTAGDFDPLLDVAIARRLLFGGLEQVVTSWVLSRRNYSLVEVLDPLFTMLARAMGASSDSIKTSLDAQREPESV